jgi:hypothetical protein
MAWRRDEKLTTTDVMKTSSELRPDHRERNWKMIPAAAGESVNYRRRL